eukprot:5233418-Amphidinium_carterae.2
MRPGMALSVRPGPIGNVDPDWASNEGYERPRLVLVQPVEGFQNQPPRRCVWALLLLSCLLILRMQQDNAADALSQDSDFPWSPFPWELHSLNGTLQATFLSPDMPTSSYMKMLDDQSALVTGSSTLVVGSGTPVRLAALSSAPSLQCTGRTVTSPLPCYLGLQEVLDRSEEANNETCYSLVAGTSSHELTAVPGSSLCLPSSSTVQSLVPCGPEFVVAAWKDSRWEEEKTCLMQLQKSTVPKIVSLSTRVVSLQFDEATKQLVAFTYLDEQLHLLTLESTTLQPMWRFQIPLTLGWVLQSPVVPTGEILLVGFDEYNRGSSFVVDLLQKAIYRTERSGQSQNPTRQKLPLLASPVGSALRAAETDAECNQ